MRNRNVKKKICRIRTGGQSGADRAASSPGTMIGLEEGKLLSMPMFTAAGPDNLPDIIEWISHLPDGTELCIGGPRASECPEAYDVTKAVLYGIAEYFSGTCSTIIESGEDEE